jgi:hypothetical protein
MCQNGIKPFHWHIESRQSNPFIFHLAPKNIRFHWVFEVFLFGIAEAITEDGY